jgi:hypothetical protein
MKAAGKLRRTCGQMAQAKVNDNEAKRVRPAGFFGLDA